MTLSARFRLATAGAVETVLFCATGDALHLTAPAVVGGPEREVARLVVTQIDPDRIAIELTALDHPAPQAAELLLGETVEFIGDGGVVQATITVEAIVSAETPEQQKEQHPMAKDHTAAEAAAIAAWLMEQPFIPYSQQQLDTIKQAAGALALAQSVEERHVPFPAWDRYVELTRPWVVCNLIQELELLRAAVAWQKHPGLSAWWQSGDRGVSSETIVEVGLRLPAGMLTARHDPPADPSDLRRCVRVLRIMPELRETFFTLSVTYPAWAPFVDAWDDLVALLVEEVGEELPNGTRAPKTYVMMKSLRGRGQAQWPPRSVE